MLMKGDHENQEYLQAIEKAQKSMSSAQGQEGLQNSREDIEVSDEEPDSPTGPWTLTRKK